MASSVIASQKSKKHKANHSQASIKGEMSKSKNGGGLAERISNLNSSRAGSSQRERDSMVKKKFDEMQKQRKLKGLGRNNSTRAPAKAASLRAPSRQSDSKFIGDGYASQ